MNLWKDHGLVKHKKFTSKKYLYDVDSVNDLEGNIDERSNVIYARVSSTKQKEDLNNQIETIKNYCISNGVIVNKIYKEIASGMNENRQELNNLVNDVIAGKVKKCLCFIQG